MVQFNFSERTIKAKVVYYGPAQSGKTTNLEQIHRLTDPAGNNRLVSLNTAQDRTLFFDLLPFSLGQVSGYDFKIQLYTVPGQVQYNATRRVVLAGADAVVFVADSRKALAKDNQAAFENMKVNLLANRLVPEKVPLVLQFNKQDLPDLTSTEELNRTLNFFRRPTFAAVANRGDGVIETFTAVVKEMLAGIAVKYSLKDKGLDPAAIPELVDAAFASLLRGAASAADAASPAAPARVILTQKDTDQAATLQAGPDTGLVSEELLQRSLRTNVELAEALADLVQEVGVGLSSILSHAELLQVYREEAREKRQAAILAIQAEAARLRKIMQDLGDAGSAARAAPATPPATPPVPPSAAVATNPTGRPGLRPAPVGPTLDQALQEGVAQVQSTLEARTLRVLLEAAATPIALRIPPAAIARAVAALLHALAALAPAGSAIRLRGERKPVLLRGRDGSEQRRDFFMLACAHAGVLNSDQQQRVLQGSDPGPFGAACRVVRELGGFVRFAPLSGGGLETRFFVPAA